MKHLPHSKLPFDNDIIHSNVLDEDLIEMKDDEDNTIAGIEYASDAEYLMFAANNFQEAIQLIKEAQELVRFSEEGTIYQTKVSEFLNKIEDD